MGIVDSGDYQENEEQVAAQKEAQRAPYGGREAEEAENEKHRKARLGELELTYKKKEREENNG